MRLVCGYALGLLQSQSICSDSSFTRTSTLHIVLSTILRAFQIILRFGNMIYQNLFSFNKIQYLLLCIAKIIAGAFLGEQVHILGEWYKVCVLQVKEEGPYLQQELSSESGEALQATRISPKKITKLIKHLPGLPKKPRGSILPVNWIYKKVERDGQE